MSVDASWDRIEAWLKKHAKDILKSLKPGVKSQALKQVETRLSVTLPPDFTASVARYNGQRDEAETGLIPCERGLSGLEPAWRLLSLDEIISTWEEMKVLVDAGEFNDRITDPAPGVRGDWWCTSWVPFADNGGGDSLCLDMSPVEGGNVGQIVLFSHEARGRPLLATSFEELLTRLADELEAGQYIFDADSGLVLSSNPLGSESGATEDRLHLIILLPVERPTPDQLRVVKEFSQHQHTNLLEIRELIRTGGFSGFGALVGNSLARVVTPLQKAGIPYRLEPLPPVR